MRWIALEQSYQVLSRTYSRLQSTGDCVHLYILYITGDEQPPNRLRTYPLSSYPPKHDLFQESDKKDPTATSKSHIL